MGGGGSKSSPTPPPPPTVREDPYPKAIPTLTNLSASSSSDCPRCSLGIDVKASTSSVRLTREFGSISVETCQRYGRDLKAVEDKQMSFQDFLTNLQSGMYSRPVSETNTAQYCEQISLPEDVAAKLNTLSDYNANTGKLKSVRIREVSGSGSFSSETKAKYTLSLPIKINYAATAQNATSSTPQLRLVNGKWSWIPVPNTSTQVSTREATVSNFTLYHPSPIRIENVQHDAVLSLNGVNNQEDVVILIPLKSSNINNESTGFFGKIAKHLTSVAYPNDVTGAYQSVDIPTGNDWNVRQVFWLGSEVNGLAQVTDGLYSWQASGGWRRVKKSQSKTEIRYGWVPDGKQARYFMLGDPVPISPTDLSYITRILPVTPPERAIHGIPDPKLGGKKPLYKAATGKARSAGCGIIRERMENKGPGEMLASVFTGGGSSDMLVDANGQPLADKGSCDPFANNVKQVYKNPSWLTPDKFLTLFFNVMMVISVALGTWLALFLIVNKDYDNKYKEFSETAGKVIGKLAMQASGERPIPPAPQAAPEGVDLSGLPKLPTGLGDIKAMGGIGNAFKMLKGLKKG